MNEKLVNRFVDSILYRAGRAGRVVARADDPRIASGELLTEKQARVVVAKNVRRILAEEEREVEREIREAFIEAVDTDRAQARPAQGQQFLRDRKTKVTGEKNQ